MKSIGALLRNEEGLPDRLGRPDGIIPFPAVLEGDDGDQDGELALRRHLLENETVAFDPDRSALRIESDRKSAVGNCVQDQGPGIPADVPQGTELDMLPFPFCQTDWEGDPGLLDGGAVYCVAGMLDAEIDEHFFFLPGGHPVPLEGERRVA